MKLTQKKKIIILFVLIAFLVAIILYLNRNHIYIDYTLILPPTLILATGVVGFLVSLFVINSIKKHKRKYKFSIIAAIVIMIVSGIFVAINEPKISMNVTALTVNGPGENIGKSYEDLGSFKHKFSVYRTSGLIEIYEGTGDRQQDYINLKDEMLKEGWQTYDMSTLSDTEHVYSPYEDSFVLHVGKIRKESKPVSLSIFFIDDGEYLNVPQETLDSSHIMKKVDVNELKNLYEGRYSYRIVLLYHATRASRW